MSTWKWLTSVLLLQLILVSDNTTADYKQIEDAFVSDLKKLIKEGASTENGSSGKEGDTRDKTSSGILDSHDLFQGDQAYGSSRVFSNNDSDDTSTQRPYNMFESFMDSSSSDHDNRKRKRNIEITETHHVPGDYAASDSKHLEDIIDKTKDKTRSKQDTQRF